MRFGLRISEGVYTVKMNSAQKLLILNNFLCVSMENFRRLTYALGDQLKSAQSVAWSPTMCGNDQNFSV